MDLIREVMSGNYIENTRAKQEHRKQHVENY